MEVNITNKATIIDNHKLETLYSHEFEKGRFFKIVFQDENSVNIQLATKTYMQVLYKPSINDIESIELVKLVGGELKEKISFSKFNLTQLKTFLQFLNEIDLKVISERKLKLADDTFDIIDDELRTKLATLLMGNEGAEIIQNLLDQEVITSQDIVNTGYRKAQLEIFRKLLYEDYINEYKKIEHGLKPTSQDEKVWQHFFNKNQWIFGYSLNYRFEGILQREFSASNTDAAGAEQVNADFLLGDNSFTTFVEIKKPDTPLFANSKNRSNCWSLSNDLIDSVSQILEQKSSGLIKIETEKELYDYNGEILKQKAYDSKCYLIIGNLKIQTSDSKDSPKTQSIKKKTFELYRRDSRNIEIITYDELYDRAIHIVSK